MHISSSHEPTANRINIREITVASQPDWNYQITLGYGTNIYLSHTELVTLTNQSIRLIADAWATEAENA